MRELWHTGWLHNRIRMISASVVTKNLQIHWLQDAHWFLETQIDADRFDKTYPRPAPDLGKSRKRALQVYSQRR